MSSGKASGQQKGTEPFADEQPVLVGSTNADRLSGEQYYASQSKNNNEVVVPRTGTGFAAKTDDAVVSATPPPAAKKKHAQVVDDRTVEIILPSFEEGEGDSEAGAVERGERTRANGSEEGEETPEDGERAGETNSTGTTWDPDFFTPKAYLRRCLGAGHPGPAWFTFSWDAIPACIFSIINMTLLATLEYYGLRPYNLGMLSYLPSFGASSTLVFYLYTSPGAQPRALILTHICGAFLGISWSHIMDGIDPPLYQLLACAFAVAMMTSIMMLTNSFQPSASATTCLAALHLYGQMKDQGYMFMVTPATIGPVIIVFLGWVFNNLIPWRHCYPCWF